MTNFQTGHDAEKQAAEFMERQGYKILELNWRTKYCEIDVVASKSKTIYFTEVKYRRSAAYGGGMEYITPKKLKQMKFAAEMWVSNKKWPGEYQLAAIELTGPTFEITNFLTVL